MDILMMGVVIICAFVCFSIDICKIFMDSKGRLHLMFTEMFQLCYIIMYVAAVGAAISYFFGV